jgi:hypothetical protein
VASYASSLMHEVEVISHSCGVAEPKLLQREHEQIINEQGLPEALCELYPNAETLPQYQNIG